MVDCPSRTPTRALQPVLLQAGDLPECIALAAASFDAFADQQVRLGRWFDSRLLNNPWQDALPGLGVGLREPGTGGRLVAFRAMFAQPWWLAGEPAVLAFAAHTAVDASARGQGLGSALIAASRDLSAISGSTSAGDITQRVYRKQGFVSVGGEDNDFFLTRCSYRGSLQARLGRPLGTAAALLADLRLCVAAPRAPAGFRVETVTRCGAEFDQLWQRARHGHGAVLDHSAQYLNWRVFDQPTSALTLTALRDPDARLRASAVWTTGQYNPTVRLAILRDLFCETSDTEAARALVLLLMAQWRRAGLTWVSLELASPWLTPLFQALGFTHAPSQGNRYQIHSRAPLPDTVLQRWTRGGLDGDYFDLDA